MKSSHLLFPNGTLVIIVHIPAYKMGSVLSLKEFLPFPMHVPSALPAADDGQYVVPSLDQTLIAVSADNGYQIELRHRDLLSCSTYGSLKYCPEMNVFHRKKVEGCLSALFNRNLEAIPTTCHWKIGPVHDYALQLTAHDFLLFQAKERLVRRTCPDVADVTEVVSGARQVHLPARCSILSDSFKFEGQLDISVTAPKYTVHGYNFSQALLDESPGDSSILAHLHRLARVGTDQGMTIRHIADDFHWRHSWHLAAKVSLVVGIIFIILVIFLGCRYRYKLGCSRLENSLIPRATFNRRHRGADPVDRLDDFVQLNATEMADLRRRVPGADVTSDETQKFLRLVQAEAYGAIEKVRSNLGEALRRAADAGVTDPDAILADALAVQTPS